MSSLSTFVPLLILSLAASFSLLLMASPVSRAAEPIQHSLMENVPELQAERDCMIDTLAVGHGITDQRVLAAMRLLPRHLFVPQDHQKLAYRVGNLPIGGGQVIGHPSLVAFMTQAIKPKPSDRVFEVGTGCGYQAAVLSKLVKDVYSAEIIPELERSSKKRLARMGFSNIHVKLGNGYKGWPEKAPFDAIIVTAAPDSIPRELISQLKTGGRMVIPVGRQKPIMKLITRTPKGIRTEDLRLTGLFQDF